LMSVFSSAKASITGDSILHGAHQAAQQSTNTLGLFFTKSSNVLSVTSTGLLNLVHKWFVGYII
jgi:hypothetical protein